METKYAKNLDFYCHIKTLLGQLLEEETSRNNDIMAKLAYIPKQLRIMSNK